MGLVWYISPYHAGRKAGNIYPMGKTDTLLGAGLVTSISPKFKKALLYQGHSSPHQSHIPHHLPHIGVNYAIIYPLPALLLPNFDLILFIRVSTINSIHSEFQSTEGDF